MANNRMVLVCNVCLPKANEWTFNDEGLLPIAKWYPGGHGAYYRNDSSSMGKDFEEFAHKHAHQELASEGYSAGAGQPNPFRLEYESVDLPILTK